VKDFEQRLLPGLKISRLDAQPQIVNDAADRKLEFTARYLRSNPSGLRADLHAAVFQLQKRYGNRHVQRVLQRQPAVPAQPKKSLIDDFETKFPAAAKLIKANSLAMKLVAEASSAGAEFGGYSEEGPGRNVAAGAYTVGHSVYVPRASGDTPETMADFLFELNNAIHRPPAAGLAAAAGKGTKSDTVAAKKYAHDIVALEVEALLRVGEIWVETKASQSAGQARKFDQYDKQFYLDQYEAFKKGKTTKEDTIKASLQLVYSGGAWQGKTTEEYYMAQYRAHAHE
jgi:hypothetical protein